VRSIEEPARAAYGRWREVAADALLASPAGLDPEKARQTIDALSLAVGAGVLGLVVGAVLHLIVG
jgi:hypothetical protein